MNVLIIEDEAPAARRVVDLVRQIDQKINVLDVIESVRKGRDWFRNNGKPDLVISDIQLADDLSFSIFKELDENIPIIFTTAYDEYAIKAFEWHSVDYLLKPLKLEMLARSIEKFREMKTLYQKVDYESLLNKFVEKEYKTRFLIYSGENLVPVMVEEIAYFYAEDGYVFLKTQNGKTWFYNDSLDNLETQLDPRRFFRLNRQYLTSIGAVAQIKHHLNRKLAISLTPSPKSEVLVSKEKASELKRWLS